MRSLNNFPQQKDSTLTEFGVLTGSRASNMRIVLQQFVFNRCFCLVLGQCGRARVMLNGFGNLCIRIYRDINIH